MYGQGRTSPLLSSRFWWRPVGGSRCGSADRRERQGLGSCSPVRRIVWAQQDCSRGGTGLPQLHGRSEPIGFAAHPRSGHIIRDLSGSASPVHGQDERCICDGDFGCVCYLLLFRLTQYGDCEGAILRSGRCGWRRSTSTCRCTSARKT
jgi:hypothetical protein